MESETKLENIKEFVLKNKFYIIIGLIVFLIIIFLVLTDKGEDIPKRNVDSHLILTLNGEKRITLIKGDTYYEKGYYAYDSREGDLTNRVIIDSNLNTLVVGNYNLKYTVINNNGKIDEEIRYVDVVADFSDVKLDIDYEPKKEAKEVFINLTVSGDGYDFILDPDGNVRYENNITYLVQANDEYTFSIKRKDGSVIEKSINISNIKKEEVVTIKPLNVHIKDLTTYLSGTNYDMVQIVTFSNGKINETYSDGCNDNTSFYLSSASKTMLGIIAAKMHEDGIINLNSLISKYWYQLNGYNFSTCTADWRSMMGVESTIVDHTDSKRKLVQNPATLANTLTHSSTIMNMNMVHMVPNDPTSEYFGGSMSSNYGRAAFMLHHTSNQLFEKNGVPGSKTEYNYQIDKLTREHALAGFTMQIAMKESVNEYAKKNIYDKIGIKNSPMFKNGNSIYFAAGYLSSALDVAKVVATIANDGVYNNKVIFKKETIDNIEKVYTNLNNQTIAFDYLNGKYIKYGNFSKIDYFDEYKLSDMYNNYSSYISYNPETSNGFVITVKFKNNSNKNNALNTFNSLSNYFYSNE